MEQKRDDVIAQDDEAQAVKKLKYEVPAVTELGRVEEMTKGGADFSV